MSSSIRVLIVVSFNVNTCAGIHWVNTLRHNTQLNRFTLRWQHKVGTQRRLYCLVQSIKQLAGVRV
jgi:hypothetical protein